MNDPTQGADVDPKDNITADGRQTMTREEITAGLAEILEEVCGVHPDEVTDAAQLTEDLDVDSLSMVEVIVVAEEKFDIKIPDEEVEGIKTVGEAVDYILNRIAVGTDPKGNIVATVEDVVDNGTTYIVRHGGENVAVVMPYDEYRVMVDRLATTDKEG